MSTRSQLRARRVWTTSIGVLGTLVLHAVLVLPFFLDLSLPAPKLPNRSGAGASATVSSAEPVLTVVFINEPSTAERKASLETLELASRGLSPVDLTIVVRSPDPLPAADASKQRTQEESSVTPQAVGDQAQRAILYGRYLGQVQARIERAWLRPRTEIGAARFSCRARIEQNPRGDVVGIKLDHCSGSERWQRSLVSAIRTASPLPAPPDPSVYADRLWLSFRSDGFRAGSPAEGFEPENRTARPHPPDQSFKNFALGINHNFQSRVKEGSDVIHLTIIGSSSSSQASSEPRNSSSGPDTTTSRPQEPDVE